MNDLPAAVPIEAVLSEKSSPPRLSFVRDVASLYHRNAWLFLKMLLPATIFGYLALYLCTARANEIGSALPHGPTMREHIAEMLEMAAFRFSGFVAVWMFYCFAFGAITVAVRKLVDVEHPLVEECFEPVRERLLPFFVVSLLLFFVTYPSRRHDAASLSRRANRLLKPPVALRFTLNLCASPSTFGGSTSSV